MTPSDAHGAADLVAGLVLLLGLVGIVVLASSTAKTPTAASTPSAASSSHWRQEGQNRRTPVRPARG